MRLTEDEIKRARRPKSGQEFLWDDLVSGLGVRLTPSATAFVVQWRAGVGKNAPKRRETLKPRWPQLTVERARDLARQRLSETVGNREAGASAPLRLSIRSWYERETELGSWRPRYRTKVDALISSYVEGEERPRLKLSLAAKTAIANLGSKPIGSVSRSDVMAVVDRIKPGIADQFLAILSSFFNSKYEREIVTSNPARNRLRVTGGRRVRRRVPSEAEFIALHKAFQSEGDPNLGAFMLLVLTGARRGEVTGMRWSEIDLEARTWTLPAERRKTGRKDPEPFVIDLHQSAIEIIERQPRLEGSPYVFWGRRDKRSFDFQHLLLARIRAKSGVTDWRLHDLRRFARSGMAKLGISQTVAELCLGHIAKTGLVAVYDAHDYRAEKREAWRRWGDAITKLVERG